MNQTQSPNQVFNRILQATVLFYQGVAVVAFILTIVFAVRWMNQPFIGGFFESTLILNGTGKNNPEQQPWALYKQGFSFGDQLMAVDGKPVRSSADIRDALASFQTGDSVALLIKTSTGETKTADIVLQVFSSADRFAYFIIPALISGVFLFVGLWIFGFRRNEPAGRAFSIFSSSLGIAIGTLFNLYTTHEFSPLWTLSVALAGASLIDLSLVFPQEARLVIGRAYLRSIGYIVAIVLSLLAFTTLFDRVNALAYVGAWQKIYSFTGFSGLFYFGNLTYRGFWTISPVVKSQARTILIGSLFAFVPIVSWLLLSSFNDTPFNPYLFLFMVAFPLVNGFVILRYRLVRTDYWIRQGIVYSILTGLVIAIYGLLVSGIGLIFTDQMPSDNPFLIGGLVFVVAVFLDPARTRLQTLVDSAFFRGQRAYEERLRTFSHELTSAVDLYSIGRVLREQIASSLVPDRLHIYIYDSLNDQYAALPGVDSRPTSDIRFTSVSPLARHLQAEKIPLYLDSIHEPVNLKSEDSRLAILGARLFVALPGEEKPVGWLALGNTLSGNAYTPRDLDFLENLADQASLAISRVQTVLDLERRVQEMNALTRVSQGVNITLTFDDVLELIFAQATQIIPSTHFHITLHNKAANYFYYGFCVDDRERAPHRENRPLPPSFGLGQEIIRRGATILTQDYSRECQARNITAASPGVYAWMGVPLNAGAETIGALSVASRDATVTYTHAQLELLQAIADQTVGAIVKARLLEETQERARQLSTLNEITRQLTSTLEQEPLLQYILDNAVSILNCESGSLFLMDDQTGDLVFRVTVGPAAGNLLGQRIPAGAGIVGRAVQTRVPVIENDGQRSAMRFDAADKQTGYLSRSLLAVPMLIKDRVLGVIEVINRNDGLPFVADDQNLLTAFAGQAAVAIENARLLALTDQELSARVEELSIMGRIVRELNASLDVDRAMNITLDWGMRRSNAEAGLIGMLEGQELRIIAQEGYDDLLNDASVAYTTLELPAVKEAIEKGQPNQVSLVGTGHRGVFPGAHTQIIVPIRREAGVIGLILLESVSDSQGNLDFLNRLSDNAAIAIYNAQLYGEVQQANTAKSEFVSLVAHELKNPMTSIKGYSELLASGTVGQINEMQTNFLGTIRSNVERMSVLVSDLNDNAKIEAGRLKLDFTPVNLAAVVEDVLRSTRRQVEEKHQEVEVSIPPQLPQVWADRIRVGQVMTNLVSNANKYTTDGGTIMIGAEETANRWDEAGARRVAHLWVRDNGIGISAEDQVKIFQRFFRSDDMKAREAPGTGLGLNITKSLVEMQGGRIWFESEYRKGTTFHFTVPIAEGISQT
ncbi:MAG: GAF domain-containing protein [Anaerolineae bacterium]|nr:GAF domain-containing protein [Anaerolineae bacterium]MBL8105769.1 GAF domain-containing protein [Anaerolineales bacterium]MCC7189637.1 GAF domain-containing protein [Anaerolineales bacterium]